MRKIVQAVLAGGIAAGIALTSTAAYADTTYTEYAAPGCGAKSTFKTYGDVLKVYDIEADGHSAVGIIENGTQYYYWNHSGNGTVKTWDLDLPENRAIALGAMLGDWQGTPTGGLIWPCLSTTTVSTS
ncbi:hypothetical protein [Streptomyces sp. NBC_00557]|uniref:hypothetical protein n=1 Tax=Streptomyces sp. NBC_00557 TaxID=2975776 RepID=UPI002E81A176|nr:hypothetical protein [Streptomyces sp. NBC_00557]WUC36717.1 hypothetical protein OG956_22095 [Streptomyces sp. NBC_00557]